MKKVLANYSSKNDINIRQIVAYKDNLLQIEEYKDGFNREDTMNVMSVTKSVTSLLKFATSFFVFDNSVAFVITA